MDNVMDGSPALSLHGESSVPSNVVKSKILGPFQIILRCSGLDLSRSSARKDGWAQSIIRIVVCALICIAMFLKCLLLITEQSKKKGPFPYPSGAITKLSSIYGRAAFGAVILVTIWFLTAMKGILYEGVHEDGSVPFTIGYPVNLSTMYGAAPVICMAFGFYTSLALAMHTLVFVRVNQEWALFNEDVANSTGLQQFKISELLRSLSLRQSELIRLANFVNQNMSTSKFLFNLASQN
ncbi:hypothetical protein TELCIR_16566 [Teladorsagia circumcincta]|uniref:Uncharacterized protein n=1 Tax=Teladorsagia circumcincta TaxID=45464 RepID=A0A2G9TV49_TELCI|nr:hypothetical protein TELCIR_16566 [Teladorsagia circumcincta]